MNRSSASKAKNLESAIISCRKCPRLRKYCTKVAKEKKRAFANEKYWGKPVPNFGSGPAQLLIVGLAPAAHGANRTGRMFTGDRSGEWLYRTLYKFGFASQSESTSKLDRLKLKDCVITAIVHCAPPLNKPLPSEIKACQPWLSLTMDQLQATTFLALGQLAWNQLLAEFLRRAWIERKHKFSHGAIVDLGNGRKLLGSYHPSQQNTFTGVLTQEMFDSIFRALTDS